MVVRYEVPSSEGLWRRHGRREWCRVFRDTLPISRLFNGELVIEFKPLNVWRVRDLPSGLRGGWVHKPNVTGQRTRHLVAGTLDPIVRLGLSMVHPICSAALSVPAWRLQRACCLDYLGNYSE